MIEDGQGLPGEDEDGGLSAVLKDALPGLGGFVGFCGPVEIEIGDGAQGGQVFDWLMGGAVLAEADAVVGKEEDGGVFRKSGKPDGGSHVVGKTEERTAIRDEQVADGDAVQNSTHSVFADAIADITSGWGVLLEIDGALEAGVVGGGQIGGAAQDERQMGHEGVKDHAGGLSSGEGIVDGELGQVVVDVDGEFFALSVLDLLGESGVGLLGLLKEIVPGLFKFCAFVEAGAEVVERLLGDVETLFGVPTFAFLDEFDLILAEG